MVRPTALLCLSKATRFLFYLLKSPRLLIVEAPNSENFVQNAAWSYLSCGVSKNTKYVGSP